MERARFKEPPASCGAVHLWMLNDRLDAGELTRQLELLKEAGCRAVIARTFDGLLTRYMSDEFMDLMEHIVVTAGRLGLEVFLQAGFMPAAVPDLEPASRLRVVAFSPHGDQGEKEIERVVARDERGIYYLRPLRHFVDLLNPEAVRGYLKRAYESSWSRLAPHFGKTISSVWVDEPQFFPTTVPWTDALPQEFERRWGYPLADYIPALFHRSPDSAKVRHHYWRTVVAMFLEAYFAQVAAWCERHGLKFSGHLYGEDSLPHQIAWTATATTPYLYMQIPGVDHLSRNLTYPRISRDLMFILTPKQCSSVANQTGKREVLAEMYGTSSQGLTFQEQRWIGDYFALMGINYRCLHGSFYSMRGRRKRIHVPHLSYQQPWWPHFSQVSTYFKRLLYALRHGTYVADVLVLHPLESAFSLFDPADFTMAGDRLADDIVAMNRQLGLVSENLMRIHRGFDYGDEEILSRMGEVLPGGRLRVGSMTYRAVVLPDVITLRESTLKLLESFIEAGGLVLAAGSLPERIEGALDPRAGRLGRRLRRVENSPEALARALDGHIPREFAVEGDERIRNLWVHQRDTEEGRLVFVANIDRSAPCSARLSWSEPGVLEEWDAVSGDVRAVATSGSGAGPSVELEFGPAESRLFLLRRGAGDGGDAKDAGVAGAGLSRKAGAPERIALSDRWSVERKDPNAITLDYCRFRRGAAGGGGSFSAPMPVIDVQSILTEERYEGPVTLQFAFEADWRPARVWLGIEDPEQCTIRVNGAEVRPHAGRSAEPAYFADRSFKLIDIAGTVRRGRNLIEVEREFRPLARPRFSLASQFEVMQGVELESVYVVGDFAVRCARSPRPQRDGCVRTTRDFALAEEAGTTGGDLVREGYPFFAGRLVLRNAFQLDRPRPGERFVLRFGVLNTCVAVVRVNAREAGRIIWHPYACDITPFVGAGPNEVEVELVNTLRNLLGPHHNPEGDPNRTHGEPPFRGRRASPASLPAGDPARPVEVHSDLWTDDYFFVSYGLRDVAVERWPQ